jgi:hypothetical protein
MRPRLVAFVGGIGGLVAGGAATMAQLALWALAGEDVWRLFVVDTARAAQMLVGPAVAEASAWTVLAAATLVHLAVSMGYGVLFAALAARHPNVLGVTAGMLYGALVYAVNLHAFTLLWPWFEGSRGAPTFGAHLVFGVALALTLRRLRVAMAPRQ